VFLKAVALFAAAFVEGFFSRTCSTKAQQVNKGSTKAVH